MGRVERCGGCGGEVVPSDGPRHAYVPAHPGCWATMCALEDDRHALVGAGAVSFVMDLVDAYAAQHPANPDRRNRPSVALHLMSLCAGIEHGLDGAGRRSRGQTLIPALIRSVASMYSSTIDWTTSRARRTWVARPIT